MNAQINIEELKTAWRVAKAAEDTANAERLLIESAILDLMPTKLEGSVSQDGVTVTYKVTRKVDTAALQAAWTTLPGPVQSAFTWKPAIVTRALHELQGYDITQAQQFFTTTPAKPAISLKA